MPPRSPARRCGTPICPKRRSPAPNGRSDSLWRIARTHAPALHQIPGCASLTAAKIVAEAAQVRRFPTEGHFARYAGTAPIPASSGARHRQRFNRRGNRQLNAAVHRIAVTQIRMHDPAKDYLAKKRAEGKTKTEALRTLKRDTA